MNSVVQRNPVAELASINVRVLVSCVVAVSLLLIAIYAVSVHPQPDPSMILSSLVLP